MVLRRGRAEHEKVGLDVAGEDLLGGLLAEVDHQGQRVGSHEGGHALLGHLGVEEGLQEEIGISDQDIGRFGLQEEIGISEQDIGRFGLQKEIGISEQDIGRFGLQEEIGISDQDIGRYGLQEEIGISEQDIGILRWKDKWI